MTVDIRAGYHTRVEGRYYRNTMQCNIKRTLALQFSHSYFDPWTIHQDICDERLARCPNLHSHTRRSEIQLIPKGMTSCCYEGFVNSLTADVGISGSCFQAWMIIIPAFTCLTMKQTKLVEPFVSLHQISIWFMTSHLKIPVAVYRSSLVIYTPTLSLVSLSRFLL